MVKVLESRKITIHEAKDLLSSTNEPLDELQQKTLSYLNSFSTISGEKARDLVNRLTEEVKLESDIAIQLVNILPKSREEIRSYLTGWKKIVSEEDLSKIYSILSSAREG